MIALLCACSDVTISIDGVSIDGGDGRFSFGMTYDGAEGNIYSETVQGYYDAGTEITAHAVPSDSSAFFCWTSGGYLSDGGVIVSYDKDYTFPITGDTWLFANFRDHDTALVRYHTNGGTVIGATDCAEENLVSTTDTLWDDFSLAYYLYPNTLPEMGYFEREGYTLIGYNTEADNSGEFYNIGGKAFEDTDEVIELYCIWSEQNPASDFTFEYDNSRGGWFITGYTGGESVSIPSTYNNEPVVGVAAGAFSENDTITSIVFPSSIRVIEDYSCNNCENLHSLVLFDSLDYLSDASFNEDWWLYSVYFSAATMPRYSNWFNNHTKKIEIMNYWKDSDRPKMIVLGGSSTTYAVDAEQLESELNRDYLVLNCGSNGANLFNMTSDWAMRFMKEGDFLLQIIEYSYWQLGGVQCRWETFRSFESCYNIFSWVNAAKYNMLYDSFNSYLDARRDMSPMTYEDYVSSLAPNGYYDIQGTLNVVTRANGSDSFTNGRKIYLGDGWPEYDFMIYYSNVQYWKLQQNGIDYAMAFTPLNRNSLYDYQTDEAMDAFQSYLDENYNINILGDIKDAIYEPAVFFDDDYHLAAPTRTLYTSKLASDLNAYFAATDAGEIELPYEGFAEDSAAD